MKKEETKYAKALDKRSKLFGIKVEGQKGWYVAPVFEQLGIWDSPTEAHDTWFKQNGKYGYYNIPDRCVVIPALYGYPLYFNEKGYAVTWKDYKAGVVNQKGETVIPFIYDEIESRYQRVPIPEDEQRTVTTDDGTVLHVGPTFRDIFRGYACFDNEGGVQAYDADCRHDTFHDWEQGRMGYQQEYSNKDVERMTLDELEGRIKKEYVRLLELGYGNPKLWSCSREHMDEIDEQEAKVKSLIHDRRQKMDSTWVHHAENAKRIGRTNRLLMRAVRKAIKLGKKTAKSLQWMEKVSNTELYEVEVFVHPEWQNNKSDLRYIRRFKSPAKELDCLITEEDSVADTHIWNIIASVGGCMKFYGTGVCFEGSAYSYEPEYWNERELTGDDGQSWDECIHFPAYQDEYFTRPFHHLYCDQFDYSFEDLCNINDFRVNVNVHLITKEQD